MLTAYNVISLQKNNTKHTTDFNIKQTEQNKTFADGKTIINQAHATGFLIYFTLISFYRNQFN